MVNKRTRKETNIMKVTLIRVTKDSKVISIKTGTLNSKATIKDDLIKTILIAYNGMLNNPDCNKAAIILEKEVK